MKILLFSKYFGYNVGGAERSMMAVLRAREAEGARIKVLFVEGVESFNAQAYRVQFPDSWEVEAIRLGGDWVHFRYWSYVISRRTIMEALARQDPGWELYTYGAWAPAALLGFPGRAVYFIRDESGLGWDVNYYWGWRRLAREAYSLAQAPAKRLWLADLERGLARGCSIVANSQFMADEARKLWPRARIRIDLPAVDPAALRASFEAGPAVPFEEQGVVLVGDQQIKGSDIFRRIAERLPHRRFMIFDRAHAEPRQQGNVVLMPWQNQAGAVYRHARMILLPSRWAEAYSRVGREAVLLDIPVIGSRRGGIPEALDGVESRLIDDIEDIDEWCRRIEAVLTAQDAERDGKARPAG